MTGDSAMLKPDCAQCAALCCIALAFDRGESFAVDKPAGVPCAHLDGRHACTIHDDLDARGFRGCVRYDCLGAGQRVVQEVFGGRSWRDDPHLLAPMMEAFRGMRKIQELLQMMLAAGGLPLTHEQQLRHAALMAQLRPAREWDATDVRRFENGPLPGEVDRFLKSLRPQAGAGIRT